ncbi:hypothetical protein [Streptomyces prunicolor]|nr:hypothetical protein [Streptomyces prunicolor]
MNISDRVYGVRALACACGGDQEGQAVRPALLLVAPYAPALGFFGRIAA